MNQLSQPENLPGYSPARSAPVRARYARTLMAYSVAAGLLVLIVLALGYFLGVHSPEQTYALVAAGALLALIAPLFAWEQLRGAPWTGEQDRRLAQAVLILDVVAGSAVIYLTGGPESIFILLIPVVPFALRLLADAWYAVAYAVAVAVFVSALIALRGTGMDHPPGFLTGTVLDHDGVEMILAAALVGVVVASSVLAEHMARMLRQRESEALDFSEKMNIRADKLSLLFNVGSALSRASSFEEVARQAVGHVQAYFHGEGTILYLLEPGSGKLRPLVAVGPGGEREAAETTLALATIGTGTARLWPSETDGGRRAVMVAPLMVENTTYGAIQVVAPPGRTFNRSKLALLDTVAAELAVTLRTAENYRATNSELTTVTSELSALTAFTRTVNSTLEADEIARNLLEAAVRLTASDYGNVTLMARDGERTPVNQFFNYPAEVEARLRGSEWRHASGAYGRALRTGSPVLVSDANEEAQYRPVLPDVRSKLAVPVLVDGVVDGMINLESREPDHYASSDVDFVVALAESTGIALNNSRLFRRCKDMAVRDGLTGLYDHSYFSEALEMEISRSERHGHRLALLFIDVDDFKAYNDDFGHPAGDDVMAWIGYLLRNSTRSSDTVARYGGEEFAVVMPESTLGQGREAAEKLRDLMERRQPDAWPRLVTVSIGVAEFPTDARDGVGLLRAADRRLYAAKRGGKNQVVSEDRQGELLPAGGGLSPR